jgi:diguanylate cyclase (GGDEF)-like protein/PAS domain S-box-containing protein
MPDGVVAVDSAGLIVYANLQAAVLTGYQRGDLVGHPIELLVPDRLRAIHKEHRRAYGGRRGRRAMGGVESDFKVRRKDGSEFSADIALGPLANGGAVAVVRDITDRRSFEATLEHQALHDPLTNLANRTLFFDRLNQAIRQGRREQSQVALVMLDLDRFKLVNDAFGHSVGDTVLKDFAVRLAGGLRASDTAARLGGDEFAAILPAVADRTRAERMVRKLLRGLKRPVTVGGQRFDVSVSAGLALYPEDGANADKLIRRADLALYAAKHDGRGLLPPRLSMLSR